MMNMELQSEKDKDIVTKSDIIAKQNSRETATQESLQLASESIKSCVVDTLTLEQIAYPERPKRLKTICLKKGFCSQDYKQVAYRIMDEYFDNPAGHVFRLSGSTKDGQLSVQRCRPNTIRRKYGQLDEEAIDKELTINKTTVKKNSG